MPTFERPANAISGPVGGRQEFERRNAHQKDGGRGEQAFAGREFVGGVDLSGHGARRLWLPATHFFSGTRRNNCSSGPNVLRKLSIRWISAPAFFEM